MSEVISDEDLLKIRRWPQYSNQSMFEHYPTEIVFQLGVYKSHDSAIIPTYGTSQAACFDVSACIKSDIPISGYDLQNNKYQVDVKNDTYIELLPGHRVLIPTGLRFDIPKGLSVRFHPRSGLSLKQGIVLGNMEAVIDSDYIADVFVILTNISDVPVQIAHGDRICQGEVVRDTRCVFNVVDEPIVAKGDRTGGFGSTGV